MTVVTHALDPAEVHAPTSATAAPAPEADLLTPIEEDSPTEMRHDGDRAPHTGAPHALDNASTLSSTAQVETSIAAPVREPEAATPPTAPEHHVVSGAVFPAPPQPEPSYSATIDLAARDVRMVLKEQREQSQTLITKLNILFVANGALLSSLTISRLMTSVSPFTLAEALEFIVSFALLVRAFLPRQVAVSPNLEDRKFLERYLALSAEQYQLQMLANLAETYNANKQRLDDVSQTLVYAAYATLCIAITVLLHMLFTYSGWYTTT